jgi:membrane protein YdbS with pleckstrin-like domain
MAPSLYQSHHCYCSRVRLFLLLLRICTYAALFAALFFATEHIGAGGALRITGSILLLLLFIRRSLHRKYACFCLSDAELIVSCGIFTHSTDHIPLSEIKQVRLHQSSTDRMLGVAHVHIYPKKKDYSEAGTAYACLSRHNAYVCVLPKRFAEDLCEKVKRKIDS